MLSINEEFYSIQGEGLHTGIPMYFVRLQGCTVGCYFCDTKYTWKPSKPNQHEAEIVDRALQHKVNWLCITGGEPYEQELSTLVLLANSKKLKTCVETSGIAQWQYLVPHIDWVTLSPKDLFNPAKREVSKQFKMYSDEIKCVVTKPSDIDYYVENYYQWATKKKPLIFQPVNNNVDISRMCLREIEERNLKNTRVMLQVHKHMGLR